MPSVFFIFSVQMFYGRFHDMRMTRLKIVFILKRSISLHLLQVHHHTVCFFCIAIKVDSDFIVSINIRLLISFWLNVLEIKGVIKV